MGITTIRYAKCLYAVLRSLTARHSHAGRAIFVIPIVTATASPVRCLCSRSPLLRSTTQDSICLYLATLLIGAAPVFVWGACVNRAAAALRTLAPAAVFVEGDALHNDLKQAGGLPSSISRLILFGASAPSSAVPSPAVSPVPSSATSPPASPVLGATQVLTWKSFLDGGDQLRGTSRHFASPITILILSRSLMRFIFRAKQSLADRPR